MKIKRKKEVWKVDIIESERGWGQKVDETKEFKTYAAAKRFVDKFNSKNTEASAPDWYMVAREPRHVVL
jgi:hypothetical protein